MGDLEDIYADLDVDISEAEFREAVEAKVEQMGGLADEETAAQLVVHELDESGGEVSGVADIEPGQQEVKFVAKVTRIGEVRSFERDDEDAPEGRVVNVEVADETGQVRITFWDERAEAASEELEVGDVLRIKGRPKDGYNGVEVNVDDAEPDDETDIEVDLGDTYRVEDLSLGVSDVTLVGRVLDTDSVRTFERDDGSEGRVANCSLGDPTGRIRVTLWDEKADLVEDLSAGESVEVVDGYVRERDGDLELHVGNRGTVERVDEDVTYEPESTPIDAVEIGQTVDLAGVVRSADPKRTFDRDDGSEGQVRNVRIQDDSGDIRVALWGDKADREIGPGDRVAFADVEIQDGWRDDLEASANWRSSVTVLDDADEGGAGGASGGAATGSGASGGSSGSASGGTTGLDAFEDGSAGEAAGSGASETGDATGTATTDGGASASVAEGGESVEFTGTVVQAGDPVILDDGEETVRVETGANLRLGEQVTVRGRRGDDGRVDADEVY